MPAHLFLTITLWSKHYVPQFPDKETEIQLLDFPNIMEEDLNTGLPDASALQEAVWTMDRDHSIKHVLSH